ncbi:histidine kinase dimerization/phosphoacceptor domain -containing protein [Sulfitobacter sp. S190]|uniref:histidine kinase dimerization/phosphoacceptor domain -containing protein n=1 Tax=Sulfitobacter sp. S190 TaxID=2867022 RepID=UPI0021A73105|nr:histidine kinase dimerization/phosphoacceptor domain -containing protein [Sulfitobacter sp. S190]UWR22556.1 GAF domain-containing protein [Sulfitobacter sp. S190]
MRAPPHPQNPRRIETLHDFGVLDTAPEDQFDDIVNLIAAICDVPTALISLVDEDRQWFKARTGMALPETPFTTAVCAHAILQDDILEIEDTRRDPRTADNTLLHDSDPPMLFYAGAPLLAAGHMPLGTLCILDNRPRRLTPFQRATLRTLAAQVVKQLELKRALRNQEILRAEMDHRVKNSLQATSSMVRIYARTIEDPTARAALDAVQRRIDSMSSLHQQLQHSGSDAKISVDRYLTGIIETLQQNAPDGLSIHGDFDAVDLPSNHASDLGIVLSEFVANSIKHGFDEGGAGDIAVRLKCTADNHLMLEATDNGKGDSAPAPKGSAVSGIGQSLVAAAASNLGGTLTHELTGDGAHLVLLFPRH